MTRDVYCPRCDCCFLVAKDEGDTAACPQCCYEFDVEWFYDQDGESVRPVAQNLALFQTRPSKDRVDAVIYAAQCAMESQMGVPREFFAEASTNFIRQSQIAVRYTTMLESAKRQLSIRAQAEWMGMRLENNRKRMRKRVRQRLRRWSILDEHWTNNPNGDW